MNQLSDKELKELSNPDLVSRMDSLLKQLSDEKRNGIPKEIREKLDCTRIKVKDIYETKIVQSENFENQRNIIYRLFKFLVQMEFVEISIASSNNLPFLGRFAPEYPACNRITIEAIEQWITISSTIAWETLLHLIYFLDKKQDLITKKSKYKKIRKWLLEKNNFSYFTLITYKAFMFDRLRRSKEVHGNSSRYFEVLKFASENNEECNANLELYNILLNLKQPIIDLCNGIRPTSITTIGDEDLFDWVNTYFNGSKDDYEEKINEIIKNMEILNNGY